MALKSKNRMPQINTYQKKIVVLGVIPAFLICAVFVLLQFIMQQEILGVLLYQSSADTARMVVRWGFVIVLAICALLAFSLYWAYKVSANLVGAFERINRELDDVIDGKKRTPISAREKDELANQLLKRINVLIQNLPENIRKTR